jgi:hypothetical protein
MRYHLFFLIMIALLAACGANSEPLIVENLPTETPAISATPSDTPLPTSTFAIMPTVTLAPTQTPQPIVDGAAPTSPLRPTFTIAPATQTATFEPQLAGLEVEYFITNNNDALTPGDNVTLFWRVNGAGEARIFRLDDEDNRLQVWNVTNEGRLTVSTDAEEELVVARFMILAESGGSVIEEILEIDMGCPFSWFFQPAPDGCPAGSPEPTQQVEQRFEGGVMIWLAATQEIFVLFSDDGNPAWNVYPDTFTDGLPESDDSLVPPAGRLQPVRGFGLVWRESEAVRERLGWALEPELGYDGIIQATGSAGNETTFLRVRDGGILSIDANGEAWDVLPITETVDPETPTPEGTS